MIYSVVIPIALLIAPWLFVRFVFTTSESRKFPYLAHAPYLLVAAVLWELALFLPNVPIQAITSETDSFTMHFIGGTVAAVLYLYTLKAYRLKLSGWQLWIGLYLFASAVGVLNELFEFAADKTGIIPLPPYTTSRDTWWDLVANTSGALTAFMILHACMRRNKR